MKASELATDLIPNDINSDPIEYLESIGYKALAAVLDEEWTEEYYLIKDEIDRQQSADNKEWL